MAEAHPENGFTFQDLNGQESFHSFARIAVETAGRAGALAEAGAVRGDRVGFIIVDPENFVLSFFAALRLGVVPVPLYPPIYLRNLGQYLEQAARILTSAGASLVVASAERLGLLSELAPRVPTLRRIVPAEELAQGGEAPPLPRVEPDDLAFLQYTPGSTGLPKGVRVTHRSVIANIHAASGANLEMRPDRDKGVSWLPLYHDMGLIGFCLSPMYTGVNQVLIPTAQFIKNVSVWMDAIHRHRATVSFGSNFAFALAARRAKPAQLDQWDLSCVRSLGCAAEPIHIPTLRAFARLFCGRSKLRESALAPAYGLAESTLAVAMKPMDEPFRTHRVDVERFQASGVVEPPREGRRSEEHISCGVPFPGHEVKIIGEQGDTFPESREGEVCVRGPSITPGYYAGAAQPTAVDTDGWLHTGDLGYTLEGQLYITGRKKDILSLNGRKIHPQGIEWAVAEVVGVRAGGVVAFSRPGPHAEELVIVAEALPDNHATVTEGVAKVLLEAFSLQPADVVCIAPGTLPKTSSGKLQRQKVRQLYLARSLDRGADAPVTMGTNTTDHAATCRREEHDS
jgi:acyl-CoA synthetase (AMP-forming)/AMP-acid ligase II